MLNGERSTSFSVEKNGVVDPQSYVQCLLMIS